MTITSTDVDRKPRRCLGCGRTFTPKRRDARTCSRPCQNRYHGLKRSPHRLKTCQARSCHNLFAIGYQIANKTKQFCSLKCNKWETTHDYAPPSARPCRTCGTIYTPTRRNSRFCSQRCKVDFLAKPKRTKTCPVCHTRFDVGRGTGRRADASYCSKECSRRQRMSPQRLATCKAHDCLNLIAKGGGLGQGNHGEHCSRQCLHVTHRKVTRYELRECRYPPCNNTFSVGVHGDKNSNTRFCSLECRKLNQNPPRLRQCPSCGRQFMTGGHGFPGANRRFCSETCRTTRIGFTVSERFETFRRFNFQCFYCGVAGTAANPLEVDHLFPISKGGAHDPSNWVAACTDCNAGKKDRLLGDAA